MKHFIFSSRIRQALCSMSLAFLLVVPLSVWSMATDYLDDTICVLNMDEIIQENLPIAPALMSGTVTSSITGTQFIINYVNGFPEEAKPTYESAIMVWADRINSCVPIHVNTEWNNLNGAFLGTASATNFANDFNNQPVANFFYPQALANALAGVDLNGNESEISVELDSSQNWIEINSDAPSTAPRMFETTLHEIAHGLGYGGPGVGVAANGNGFLTNGSNPPLAAIWSNYVVYLDGGSNQVPIMNFLDDGNDPSVALGNVLTGGNIFWSGANAVAEFGGLIELSSPSSYQPASSYYHLDNTTFSTYLMAASGGALGLTEPSALEMAILRDLGWPTQTVEGCIVPEADNYNPNANCDDNTCQYTQGCTDDFAANFNPNASQDDGSCAYPNGTFICPETAILPSGTTPVAGNNPSNSNVGFPTWSILSHPSGSPSGQIIDGGTNACGEFRIVQWNFYADGNIVETCEQLVIIGDSSGFGCGDESAVNYNSVLDPACGYDQLCEYSQVQVSGCMDISANNYNPNATENDGSCIFDNLCDCPQDTTPPNAPAPPADLITSTPADWPPPVELSGEDNCSGTIMVSPSAVITPGDCENQLTMVRTWTFIDNCGNMSFVSQTLISTGEGCTDPTASNFNSSSCVDDGSCESGNEYIFCPSDITINLGESTDTTFTGAAVITFNPSIVCPIVTSLIWSDLELDTDGCTTQIIRTFSFEIIGGEEFCFAQGTYDCDQVITVIDPNCGGSDTPGCTDSTACNYNFDADIDDGSCLTQDCEGNCGGSAIAGCTNSTASNFNPEATCSDESCEFLVECVEDWDLDGVCDADDADDDNDGILDIDECRINGDLAQIGFEGQWDNSILPTPITSAASPSTNMVANFDFSGTQVDYIARSPDYVGYIEGTQWYDQAEGQSFAVLQAKNNDSQDGVQGNSNDGNDGLGFSVTAAEILAEGAEIGDDISISFLYAAGYNYGAGGRGADDDSQIGVWYGNGEVTSFPIGTDPDETILSGAWNPIEVINGRGVMSEGSWKVFSASLIWDGGPIHLAVIALTGEMFDSNAETIFLDDIKLAYLGNCANTDGEGEDDSCDGDSDGDGCSDTIEAGHEDPDNDGFLGTSPVEVDANGLVLNQGGYSGNTAAVQDASVTNGCEPECTECPGDISAPAIVCPDALVLTQEQYDNLAVDTSASINGGSGNGGEMNEEDFPFFSEYIQTTENNVLYSSFYEGNIMEEGRWVLTDNPPQWHVLFEDCADSEGNDDGSYLMFNGAGEAGVPVLCQTLEVVSGESYTMNVQVASLLEGNPAALKFTANGIDISGIQNANLATCQWSEFTGVWTANMTGSVDFCVVNENTVAGGNDFGLDNYSVINSQGEEIAENGSFDENAYVVSGPTVTDECDEVELTYVDVQSLVGCNTLVERTWTATDACSNTAFCFQNITIEGLEGCTDSGACNYNPDAVCENGSCIQISQGECDCEGNVVDECGNCGGTSVAGCTDPEASNFDPNAGCDNQSCEYCTLSFACPIAEENYECADEIPSASADDIIILESCGEVTVTWSDSGSGNGCSTAATVTRVYTITDDVNTLTCEVVYTAQDNTPPVFGPMDIYITGECGEISVEDLGITATDNCGDVTITYEDMQFSPGCLGSYQRTYTATDNCGNYAEIIQIIELTNNNGPMIECPEDANYQCVADVPEAVEPEVSHGCNLEIVSLDYDETAEGTECFMTLTRVWTAVDACGGVSTCTQTITIEDTQAPEIICPEGGVAECSDAVVFGEPSTNDNCSEVTLTFVDSDLPGACTSEYTRTWTATDECGNSSSCSQTITTTDTLSPVIAIEPDNLTLECDEEDPGFEPIWSDNCDDELEISAISGIIQLECGYQIQKSWTATDNCGNSTTVTQIVTFVDTTSPVAEEQPEDLIIECGSDVPPINLNFIDNCDDELLIEGGSATFISECEHGFEESYTATDDCGNSTSIFRTVTFVDTTAPSIAVEPEDLTLECDEEDSGFEPQWSDICDDELELSAISGIIMLDCGYQIQRSWTATDDCGNSITVSQTVDVVDTTNPLLQVPGNLTFECDDLGPFGEATATDNCDDDVEITVTETETAAACGYEIERIFRAVDDCGNESIATQIISVLDTTAPSIAVEPENLTLECDEEDPGFEPVWSDNCDQELEISAISGIIILDCGYQIQRSWTATDDCGNSTTVSQTVTFVDTTAPTFTITPEDVTVECYDQVPATEVPTATDNCQEPTVVCEESEDLDECGNGVITITCTATDDCGNENITSYSISINDTTAPELAGTPGDMVLDCLDELPEPANVEAIDNCDENVTVVYEELIIGDLPTEGSSSDCALSTPAAPICHNTENWSLVLFHDSPLYFSTVSASFVEFDNGTAHLSGTVSANNDASSGFEFDVWFENGMNWDDWSTQLFPTGYKDECGSAAVTDEFENWMYYLFTAGSSDLTGYGSYAGSSLALTHAPENYYFGYQVGLGANNVNQNFGNGGWFIANGSLVIDGQEISNGTLQGDFAFDADCCPQYEVERSWFAVDCSGNTSEVYTQNISFELLEEELFDEPAEFDSNEGTISISNIVPNPAIDQAAFSFELKEDMNIAIDIVNINGNVVQKVFDGSVSKDVKYIEQLQLGNLTSGVYIVRISSKDDMNFVKLVVE